MKVKAMNPLCTRAFVAVAAIAAFYPRPARAHDTWVLMQDYAPRPSTPAVLSVLSSHVFAVPGTDPLAREKVASVTLLRPDGTEIPSVHSGSQGYQSSTPLQAKGSYLALVKQQGGFFSKTPDGHVQKNKKEATNALECRFSEKHAKAIFTVGGPAGSAYSKVLGLPMELVPSQDPAALKAGDVLQVKVLMDGKPASTIVYGTYAGFSEDPGTFAYATSTKEGIAKIRLLKSGTWLLLAKQESAYRDPLVCDKQTYAGSLTFQVK